MQTSLASLGVVILHTYLKGHKGEPEANWCAVKKWSAAECGIILWSPFWLELQG